MTTNVSKNTFTGILQENKGALQNIENFKNQKISTIGRNLLFGGVALGGLFAVSLIAFQILSGIFALFLSGVLLIGGFLSIRFLKKMDPLIQQKTKNLLLEKMLKEARDNATVQLGNQVLANADKLKNARQAREKMGAMVEALKNAVDFSDTENSSNKKKKDIYERVNKSYEIVKQNISIAQQKHKEFEQKVIEYKELEKFTKMAGEAMALFEDSSNTKLTEMLSLESFEHIDSEFNTALVTIENSTLDREV
ncbi:MAG: hypothetical protein U9N30_04430 [Campylobacterota bacterium]|nr:hypothetical protein [Campylobacterota bacterium]